MTPPPEFLYHKVCIPNKNRAEILDSVEKFGLMSHSTLGRCGERGQIPIEHRIWFQTKMKTAFDNLESVAQKANDCVVFRVPQDAVPNQTEMREDDQFHDENRETVIITSPEEFIIAPQHLQQFNAKKSSWKPVNSSKFQPKRRSEEEKLSPWVRDDFKKYNIDMDNSEELTVYMNSECFGEPIYEEYVNMTAQAIKENGIKATYDEKTKDFIFQDDYNEKKFRRNFGVDCKKFKQ